ncbi:immunoglobulin domain-containing protein oig-4 [Drosophila sulfurigaster albostrigata]|uniref:immunoglobulin domain-containing protein oig-4 n=1 Tax=Drosophila sulfurigaster albostrigata TaxID=89887 RepID=UPI002D21A242|nr:immunoglobulin domain-containing protein oig-4 [Drosophila sulfurigaster albostrigata]
MSRSQSEFDVDDAVAANDAASAADSVAPQTRFAQQRNDSAYFPGGFLKMQLRCLLICLGLSLGLLMLTTPVCEARRGRGRGRTKSRVQIGLPITGKYRDPESDQYYNNNNGAKILQASHFDLEYVLGHKIAFLCVAKGNPRPHITWYKDGAEIYQHLYMHVHEWRIGDDRVKSKIEIDPATQMDAGLYECTADNMYSIDRRSFKTDFSIAFD